jgi:hypothetical protein
MGQAILPVISSIEAYWRELTLVAVSLMTPLPKTWLCHALEVGF